MNDLNSSLVNDLLRPLVFQPAWKAANVDDIRRLSIGGIFYGKVIGATNDFLIVAGIVFLIAKFVFKEKEVATK